MEVVAEGAALTRDGALTLGITLLALLLFIADRWRADVVAGLVATLLVVTGLLTPVEAISGFGNEATVTIGLLLLLTAALMRTGAIDRLGYAVGRLSRGSETRLLVVVLGLVVPLSAFINNTAAVAVLLPVVLGLARSNSFSPSRVLLPLSFASQLGGMLTLIGSSTNLVVAGVVAELGMERLRLFDVTMPGLLIAGAGVLYLLTLGRVLTPHREPAQDLLESYELNDYLATLRVGDGSSWAGSSIGDARLRERHGITVVTIERADGGTTGARASTLLRAGDLLLVEGTIGALTGVAGLDGIELVEGEPRIPSLAEPAASDGAGDPGRTAEVMVPPRSSIVGRTLREVGFRARYGIGAIGLRRHGQVLREPIADVRLQPGDLLLVQGPAGALRSLHEEGELTLVGPVTVPARRPGKMGIAVAVMAGVVAAPALGLAPILVSAMVGSVIVLLTGCLRPEEAYEDLDWSVLVLIGALLPLGIAMQRSGAAGYVAAQTLAVAEPLGAYGLLAAVYILAVALSAVVSNAVAAVVLTPVAAAVAAGAGLSPMPFIIAVLFAASNAFLTPIGYQTNLFVYGPGGYRFSDYVRVGAPLTVITIVVATLAVPMFFPF